MSSKLETKAVTSSSQWSIIFTKQQKIIIDFISEWEIYHRYFSETGRAKVLHNQEQKTWVISGHCMRIAKCLLQSELLFICGYTTQRVLVYFYCYALHFLHVLSLNQLITCSRHPLLDISHFLRMTMLFPDFCQVHHAQRSQQENG